MRILIKHEIEHVFEPPVRFLNAVLRLTPRSHESQHVVRWRVEIDGDSRIRAFDDAFGNCMHTLSMSGQTDHVRIIAEGVVDTFDAAGIVRATVERFPPELFLRETDLTAPDERLRAMAADIAAASPKADAIERMHALLLRIADAEQAAGAAAEASTQAQTQAAAGQQQSQAQSPASPDGGDGTERGEEEKRARARSLAHDFIVAARLIGVPARFVSGYLVGADADSGGAHFWAEAHAQGVGWIGFDPANAICPHESHVRMAVGLDALDAACVRAAPTPHSVSARVVVRRQS